MGTPTVNVVRYSALFGGVVYGWYHNRTLQQNHKKETVEHVKHDREVLIKKAKEAYQLKKNAPKDTGLITDPEDPRFDLEKLFSKWERDAS